MVQKRALLNCDMTSIGKEQTISIQNYYKKAENTDTVIWANKNISQKIDHEGEKNCNTPKGVRCPQTSMKYIKNHV